MDKKQRSERQNGNEGAEIQIVSVSKHEILNPGFRLVFRAEFLKIVVWHQYWGIPSSQIRESRAWSRGVSGESHFKI